MIYTHVLQRGGLVVRSPLDIRGKWPWKGPVRRGQTVEGWREKMQERLYGSPEPSEPIEFFLFKETILIIPRILDLSNFIR